MFRHPNLRGMIEIKAREDEDGGQAEEDGPIG